MRRIFTLSALLILNCFTLFSQVDKNGKVWEVQKMDSTVSDLSTYSTDEILELVVTRYKSEVELYILAKRPFLFSKIVILRRKIEDNKYSQVKLLEPKDFKPDQLNQIIKTIDKYPEPGQIDVYYKLVGFTKSGAEYIFPSVYLKGFRNDENDTIRPVERFVPIHDLN